MSFLSHPIARGLALVLATLSVGATILVGRIGLAAHTPFADRTNYSRLECLTGVTDHAWQAIHILAGGCRCSSDVAKHLATRKSLPGLRETVVLAGTDPDMLEVIRHSGFLVVPISAERLSQSYGVQGAPWFVLIAPNGSVRYAGGYAADRSARYGYQDVAIWRALSSGKHRDPLPVFGCAVGQRARKAVDPFGIQWKQD